MKVAIVHDWLTNFAGAERVVLALHQLFPQAPIYTSVYNPAALPQFKGIDVRTSYLQHWPLVASRHQWFPILRARAFESFDFSQYDLVISSSSAEAKGIITNPQTLHISYCHTPTRYYWSDYATYYRHPGFGLFNPLVRMLMPRLTSRMRLWDYAAAQRVDYFIANSKTVAKRINKYYRRKAEVIYPPVDIEKFKIGRAQRKGFLVAGRQVAYKRLDLAVAACTQLQLPLTVIGYGPEHSQLRRLAGSTINFISDADDAVLAKAYQEAEALIFPGEEDFGMVAVEALASGCPVIALKQGGVSEIISQPSTGLFFEQPTVAALKTVLQHFKNVGFDTQVLRKRAEQFSQSQFHQHLDNFIKHRTADFEAQKHRS